MSSMKDLLDKLHNAVAENLLTSMASEEGPSDREIANAIKFLKDNHIEVSEDETDGKLKNIADTIRGLSSAELTIVR